MTRFLAERSAPEHDRVEKIVDVFSVYGEVPVFVLLEVELDVLVRVQIRGQGLDDQALCHRVIKECTDTCACRDRDLFDGRIM